MIAALKSRAILLLAFLACLWGIEAVDQISHGQLDAWGALRPRSDVGLMQIFTAPFLHGGWAHLWSNSLAFLPLAALTMVSGAFWRVTLTSILVGGLGAWLFSFGPSLGFSGVLFGFTGYLLARGLVTRRPLALIVSCLTLVYFGGGLLSGLIPQQGISWAGHFWGFVGGLLAARSQGKQA